MVRERWHEWWRERWHEWSPRGGTSGPREVALVARKVPERRHEWSARGGTNNGASGGTNGP